MVTDRCETGESTASITRRGDDAAWPKIRVALAAGAHLHRPAGLKRYYPFLEGRPGTGSLSETRVKTLEHGGVLKRLLDGSYELIQ